MKYLGKISVTINYFAWVSEELEVVALQIGELISNQQDNNEFTELWNQQF